MIVTSPFRVDNLGSLGARKSVCRFGAAAWPLPGVAAFVQAIGTGCHIIAIEANKILTAGITCADAMSYLDTAAGVKFMKTTSFQLIPMKEDTILFVPYGWMAMLLHYNPDPEAENMGFCLAMNYMYDKWWGELPANGAVPRDAHRPQPHT